MQEENFRKALIGYHKEDVNNHIENLMIDNRRAIKLKEENIQNLQKRVSELELNVTRLSEIETQFSSVQQKLQHATQALEEKNNKINLLSLRADELQEKLNQIPEVVEPDHSREEALVAELMLLKNELLLVRKEKDETSLQFDQLKETIDTVRKRELEFVKNYQDKMKAYKEREALLEREKIVIAYAILRAQEKADEMDKELEVEYSKENKRLKNYKKEIESFRMKAIEVLQLFEEELSILSNEGLSSTIKPETDDSSLKSHTSDTAGSPQIQLIKRG